MKFRARIASIIALAALTVTFASLRIARHGSPNTIAVEVQQAHAGNSTYMYNKCLAYGQWTDLALIRGVDGKDWAPIVWRAASDNSFVGAPICFADTADIFVLCRQYVTGPLGPPTWVRVNFNTPMAF